MDGILLKNGERKAPYESWKQSVIREWMKCRVVRAFAELKDKERLTVLYLDEGEILRRVMRLEHIEETLDVASAGSVWMFSGILRMGDIIDVGEGGTLWDSTIRYGLVCEWSDVLWFENGREEQVVEALNRLTEYDVSYGIFSVTQKDYVLNPSLHHFSQSRFSQMI